MHNKYFWFLAVIAALLMHIPLLYIPALRMALVGEKPPVPKEPQVVELWDSNRAIVQTQKSADKIDRKAKFDGDFENRVEEETVSSEQGKFELSDGKLFPSVKDLVSEELGLIFSPASTLPPSSNPHALGGIKIGKQNVLNTDRVSYAGYMNRIGNEIYDRWVGFANEAYSQERARMREDLYVSKVKLLLNEKGEVVEIQNIRSSGILALDEAAAMPFWEAVFPNPPKSIFKGEFAEVNFEFYFEVGGINPFVKVLTM